MGGPQKFATEEAREHRDGHPSANQSALKDLQRLYSALPRSIVTVHEPLAVSLYSLSSLLRGR
jgi:hypothetical protein